MKELQHKKDISFVVLNYRCSHLTKDCVASILKHLREKNIEIIIVDNGSGQKEIEELEKLCADKIVKLFKSRLNTGFGLGNMMGANIATGRYLCFMNPDTYIDCDCVTPLCQYLEQNPMTGCVAPMQIKHNNQTKKDKSCTLPKEINKLKIPGSFLLFESNLFWEIHGFDTNIFLYCEEEDIGRRLKRIGKHCTILTNLHYYHHVGATTKHDKAFSKLTEKEYFRSKLYVYRKHHNRFLSAINHTKWIIKILVTPHRWHCLQTIFSNESMSKSIRHYI